MRPILGCFNAGWLRVTSLLIPVGPPLGLGASDERAWEQLAEELA